MSSWINQIYLINKVLSGNPDFKELDWLSIDEKKSLAEELLKNISHAEVNVANIINCIGHIIPRVSEECRLGYAKQVIAFLEELDQPVGRATYQVFDAELVRSLSYADRIAVADLLRDQMKLGKFMARESNMWGLVRIIPFLRDIHQKEYAHDICELSHDGFMRQQVLDALCTLIFSLTRESRTDIVYFFAEVFKKGEQPLSKLFILDLLKKVTSSVQQKDRTLIADAVAPLLFHTDPDLVHKSVDYFATVLGFLPADQRLHYIDMVSGLLNDLSMREHVVASLERMMPFLQTEHEKEPLRRILAKYSELTANSFTSEAVLEAPSPRQLAYEN